MALGNTTQLANRYGLNLKFYKYDKTSTSGDFKGDLATTIDFVNNCSLEITGETVWATGGQSKKKLIGFDNPLEGTFTISSQISTMELLALATGEDPSKESRTKVTFGNNKKGNPNFYVVEGETVYKDEDGITYSEMITLCKASINKDYSAEYTGDGDPQSIDIKLDLVADGNNEVVIIERADEAQDQYIVTFNSNGGTDVDSQEITAGALASQPSPDPARPEYTFVGWFTDNGSFENEFNFASTEINNNITLYAKWADAL